MFVSVIVPNYNHAEFLGERLESIFQQTYQNFEVIILDDCSTDNSLSILEEYRLHPKVSKFIVNDQNSGAAYSQWKKGVELAKGQWIWIAESDDYASTDFLETVVSKLKKYAEAGVCYTDSLPINEKGEPMSSERLVTPFDSFVKEQGTHEYCSRGEDEIRNKLIYKNFLPNASAVIFKKDLFIKSADHQVHYKFIADWWVWFRVLRETFICHVPRPLNYFRFHEGTTRSTPEKKVASILERYDLLQHFQEEGYVAEKDFYDSLFYYLKAEMRSFSVLQKLAILRKVHAYDKKVFNRLGYSLLKK